jgi:hydroxymethylpyrimidine pyrophosphatase-like HAD family hydrolase
MSDTAKKREKVKRNIIFPLIKDVASKFTPQKMYFYGHFFHFIPIRSQINKVFAHCRKAYSGETEIILQCRGDALVAYPAFLTKGRALAEALRISGLSPKDVVVAGDEKMDLSMMSRELSGYPLCPRNADPEVRECVLKNSGVVGSSDTAEGIMDAFNVLARRHGWNWPRIK